MFHDLETLPADPILGLNQTFQQDSNPDKINLSVGVYQNASGHTPIFTAVKKAEQQLIDAQTTKSYAPQAGDPVYLDTISRLLLSSEIVDSLGGRLASVMTPGGCGALRMGAELLVATGFTGKVWVSDPTWANHFPLLQSAGLTLESYRYYDSELRGVNFASMMEDLEQFL